MQQLKELLVDQLQDLLHAETQLTAALPKMADAAHNPKLKEAFRKHLTQTEGHIERLRQAFEGLGEDAKPKPCKAMMGLIQEGEETIDEGASMDPDCADLALIAAAQRVEHYEISAYGTARSLARQAGDNKCARLLSHTLGEEESADFLLSAIADPLLQQVKLEDMHGDVNLESVGQSGEKRSKPMRRKSREQVEQGVA
jgi:Mn-containing catalase